MKKTLKAALLSILVFPGAGQFLLKKYVLGCLLAGFAFIAFCVIMVDIMQRALLIAEQIQRGEIPFDVGTISTLLIEQHSIAASSSIVSIATIVLISTWIISIIDSSITRS